MVFSTRSRETPPALGEARRLADTSQNRPAPTLAIAQVVVATRGRAASAEMLLNSLEAQHLRPTAVIVVGVEPSDLPPTRDRPFHVQLILSDQLGSSRQRNVGIEALHLGSTSSDTVRFIAFFDDDFRPAPTWLSEAANAFCSETELVGLTGRVLADGIKGAPITEAAAQAYLDRRIPARSHWSNGPARALESLYGCNMALTEAALLTCRFDEALPAYSWQEDCDLTGQAKRLGATRLVPACRGVHLGAKQGRVSGVKMGYSQVANPLWIARRGNMTFLRAARFVLRALAANLIKSCRRHTWCDYRGRLRGNILALADLLMKRCHPGRILQLS